MCFTGYICRRITVRIEDKSILIIKDGHWVGRGTERERRRENKRKGWFAK